MRRAFPLVVALGLLDGGRPLLVQPPQAGAGDLTSLSSVTADPAGRIVAAGSTPGAPSGPDQATSGSGRAGWPRRSRRGRAAAPRRSPRRSGTGTSPAPAPTPEPTTTVARGAVWLAASRPRVDARGRVRLLLRCSATGPCVGRVIVQARRGTSPTPDGSTAFSPRAGRSATVRVTPSKATRRLVTRRRTVRASLAPTPTGGMRSTRPVTLLAR